MSSFFEKGFGTFLAQIISTFISLVTSMIITRSLGPQGKGVYTLLVLIISMIASFGTLGMGTANIYFVGKKRNVEDIVSNSFLVSSIVGAAVIMSSFFFLNHIVTFVENIVGPWVVLAMFFTLPFRFASFFMVEVILGQNRIRIYNIYNILGGILNLIFLGLIWSLTNDTITAALLAYLLTPFGLLLFTLVQVRKEVAIKLRINLSLLKESLIFGLKAHLGTILGYLIYRVDMFLIGFFMGPKEVGYYSIAVGLAELIWYVPDSVATVLFPKVVSNEGGNNNRTTSTLCRNSIFILIVFASGVFLLGKPAIIILYGYTFKPSIAPLWLLLPGIVAMGIDRILSCHITGSGKPLVPTYAISISLIVNILLNLILIPRWGIEGAAIATSISYSLDAAILIVYFLKISGCQIRDTLVIKISDINLYLEESKKLTMSLLSF